MCAKRREKVGLAYAGPKLGEGTKKEWGGTLLHRSEGEPENGGEGLMTGHKKGSRTWRLDEKEKRHLWEHCWKWKKGSSKAAEEAKREEREEEPFR